MAFKRTLDMLSRQTINEIMKFYRFDRLTARNWFAKQREIGRCWYYQRDARQELIKIQMKLERYYDMPYEKRLKSWRYHNLLKKADYLIALIKTFNQ